MRNGIGSQCSSWRADIRLSRGGRPITRLGSCTLHLLQWGDGWPQKTDQDGVAVVKTTQDERQHELLHHSAVDVVFQLSQPAKMTETGADQFFDVMRIFQYDLMIIQKRLTIYWATLYKPCGRATDLSIMLRGVYSESGGGGTHRTHSVDVWSLQQRTRNSRVVRTIVK